MRATRSPDRLSGGTKGYYIKLIKLGGASGAPPRIQGATLARRVVYAGLALVSLRSTSCPPRRPARFAEVNPAPLAAFFFLPFCPLRSSAASALRRRPFA